MHKLDHLHYQSFFDQLFEGRSCGALLTGDGRPVHIAYEYLSDIGTLPRCGQMTQQYLNLQDRQVAIVSDPYSGGTTSSTITFLIGVELKKSATKTAKKSADLVLALRIPLRPRIQFTNNVEQEGLRIPPTPISDNGKVAHEILAAIAAHPLCPDNFSARVEMGLKEIEAFREEFLALNEVWAIDWKPSSINGYFAASLQLMKNIFQELAVGEVVLQTQLDGGEKIKLHAESQGEKIIFDFMGTSDSSRLHLTDVATFGACFGAVMAISESHVPVNAGTFRFLEVRSPSGSFLNSQYPSPTYLGMTDGVNLVANFVLKCLGQIISAKEVAASGAAECQIDIDFEDGQHFFDSLAGGTGAGSFGSGSDGLAFWKRSRLQASIEEIEKRFPMLITTLNPRQSSGGSGLHSGGAGLSKSYKMSKPAKVRWFVEQHQQRPDGAKSGFHGHESAIFVVRAATGAREKLAPQGETDLLVGDTLILQSPGGGGFGKLKAET